MAEKELRGGQTSASSADASRLRNVYLGPARWSVQIHASHFSFPCSTTGPRPAEVRLHLPSTSRSRRLARSVELHFAIRRTSSISNHISCCSFYLSTSVASSSASSVCSCLMAVALSASSLLSRPEALQPSQGARPRRPSPCRLSIRRIVRRI